MTNKDLIQKFEVLVSEEKKATRLVLEHIALIESRRAYLDLGFDGMYSYMVQGLGYSEGSAHRRIMASRTLKMDQSVGEKVEQGRLNLTQLSQVAQLCRTTKQMPSPELFTKLENQAKSASEQILAEAFQIKPKTLSFQKTQADESVRMEVTFSKEQFEALKKARSHLSHICPDGDWAQVMTELACRLNSRFEVKKSVVTKKKTPPVESLAAPTPSTQNPPRKRIRLTVHRKLLAKADHHCEYIHPPSGRRCGSDYQLQVDHRFPLSWGGRNAPENLQILCAGHNRAKGDRPPR